MAILLIVGVWSVVQSLFGVGLLVFGTPLLLLLGYSFTQTLCILLPCSLVVSLAQTVQGWHVQTLKRWHIPLFVLPGVVIGLFFVLKGGQKIPLRLFVGGMLVLTAGIRLFPRVLARVRREINELKAPLFFATGLVHGLTNMGGGMLTIVASSLESEKEKIRVTVAYGYLLMAATQLLAMGVLGKFHYDMNTALLPAFSFSVYGLLGNRMFCRVQAGFYGTLLTLLMFSFGGVLLFFR